MTKEAKTPGFICSELEKMLHWPWSLFIYINREFHKFHKFPHLVSSSEDPHTDGVIKEEAEEEQI